MAHEAQEVKDGCWLLDAGCWMLDAGYWILDAGGLRKISLTRRGIGLIIPGNKASVRALIRIRNNAGQLCNHGIIPAETRYIRGKEWKAITNTESSGWRI